MMFRLITQVVLAASLLQVYPSDAGMIERQATLPESAERSLPAVETMISLANQPLPSARVRDLEPVKVDPTSVGVVTSAISATVVDRASGAVLYAKNADSSRSIGSITKLMTAYVFLGTNPDLDAPAQIEAADVRYGGRQHIQVADQVTVRDLLLASLVGSDNSSTAALVRLSGLSWSDFIAKMNQVAGEMGMTQTTFVDATGLGASNRSVVSDVVRLLDEAVKNEVIREATQQATVVFEGASGRVYRVDSTDELLGTFVNRDPYKIIGGKTGYLPEAGYCLGTVFSEEGKREIVVVVLGSDSKQGRFQDVKALAAWAYKVFDWPDQRSEEREI